MVYGKKIIRIYFLLERIRVDYLLLFSKYRIIKMSNAPFSYKYTISNVNYYHPAFPGAWLMDREVYQVIPIFTSLSEFTNSYLYLSFADIDNQYIVLPGFKLIVYVDGNYTGSSTTFDNTTGIKPKYGSTNFLNQGNSCQLYYNNNLISEPS
jgi:hypothetical protein